MNYDKITIFDTTLRDGLQGVPKNISNKSRLKIAKAITGLGVDVIEAGFPASNTDMYRSVNEIAKEFGTKEGPAICGLARVIPNDIVQAAKAIEPAYNQRIHSFIGTSPLHRDYKLKKSKDQILELTNNAVERAKRYVDDVQFSLEDFGRTEPEFAFEVVKTAYSAGARTINLPETVGSTRPKNYGKMISYIRKRAKEEGLEPVLSVHCHNDRGLATEMTLAGLEAGARQAEVTINQLGERAGNSALEEVIANLMMGDVIDEVTGGRLYSDIKSANIGEASKTIQEVTGIAIGHNKPIVGTNPFHHSSGIHQDGFYKNRETYEIFRPEDFGMETIIRHNKQSGRNAIKKRYEELGVVISDKDFQKAAENYFAIDNENPDDADLIRAMYDREEIPKKYILYSIHPVYSEKGVGAVVKIGNQDKIITTYAEGNGPIDAAVTAIKKEIEPRLTMDSFSLRAEGPGSGAVGYSYCLLKQNGWSITGTYEHTDSIRSAVEAFIKGCNRLEYIKSRLKK
ncbi:MAG: 2-isopropylmalate synthase [Nanoarchaeota archaeon]